MKAGRLVCWKRPGSKSDKLGSVAEQWLKRGLDLTMCSKELMNNDAYSARPESAGKTRIFLPNFLLR